VSAGNAADRLKYAAQHKVNLDEVVLPLLTRADTAAVIPYVDSDGVTKQQHAQVGLVKADEFLALFEKLNWHQDYQGVIDPLRAFIATATDKERIKDWAIIWPQRAGDGRSLEFEELSVPAPIFKRARRQLPRIDFTGENKRNILAAGRVSAGEAIDGLGASETRGVLVISLVADRDENSEGEAVTREDVVGMLSLRVPDKSVQSKRDHIQYGVVVPNQANEVAVDVGTQRAD
jgi:hypothetical protein